MGPPQSLSTPLSVLTCSFALGGCLSKSKADCGPRGAPGHHVFSSPWYTSQERLGFAAVTNDPKSQLDKQPRFLPFPLWVTQTSVLLVNRMATTGRQPVAHRILK